MSPVQASPSCPRTGGWRTIAAGVIVAGTAALTGCATSGHPADASRDRYVGQAQADPLGAWLASRDIVRSTGNADSTGPQALASTALTMLGTKYRFGGGAPSTGFDCSGLVGYAAEKSLGLKLPRQASEIARLGQSVKRAELQEGDLVFFNTRGRRFSHVGIYLGDRKFVHAPRTGAVVRIESMDVAYWKKRYNGARRLASASQPASGAPELRLSQITLSGGQ
ncbi:MAG: C40 family peptidase [Castellaniella sp.]